MAARRLIAAIGLAIALSGCASGTKWTDAEAVKVPPPRGQSRIVVFRDGLLGAAVQPTVTVNGRGTGTCQPNGAFFVNVPPGRHEVTATTEVTNSVQVETAKGSTAYVQCSIGIGFFVGRPHLTPVTPAFGEKAVQPLVFTGAH